MAVPTADDARATASSGPGAGRQVPVSSGHALSRLGDGWLEPNRFRQEGAPRSGVTMSTSERPLQAVFYNNPDTYPPIVNSARLAAEAGFTLDLLCRANGEQWDVFYPPQVHVRRIDTRGAGSMRE